MRISRLLRTAQSALRTEQGRAAGRNITDRVADQARRVAPEQHTAKIDKARGAAHRYLGGGDARHGPDQQRDPEQRPRSDKQPGSDQGPGPDQQREPDQQRNPGPQHRPNQ